METIVADGSGAALFTLLYVSELAEGGAEAIDRICRQSRANNERVGITGVLVFDGHAFCQFVEGAEPAIADLLGRLERDPRHVKMHVLQFGRAAWARRFASWRLGYAYSADPAAIARIAARRDDAALAAFTEWVPALTPSDESEARGG